jgi:hypothetical protein
MTYLSLRKFTKLFGAKGLIKKGVFPDSKIHNQSRLVFSKVCG